MKRSKSHFGIPLLTFHLPELPFNVEKTHLLVFIIVFFVVLFAYDQSMPPVRVGTGTPLAVGDNAGVITNQTNASLEQVSDEVIYPEPNGTTEVPLEINASVEDADEDNETGGNLINDTAPDNDTVVNESQVNDTSEEEVSESEEIPEEEPEDVDNTPEETPEEEPENTNNTPEEPQEEPEGDVEVTYYFFWAEYCSTCKTMMPWIREVGRAHPSLNVEMIDLRSGSSYIQRFSVSSTAVSVIIKRVDSDDVSGTKMMGFMDQDGIERLACSELDDAGCEKKYPKG